MAWLHPLLYLLLPPRFEANCLLLKQLEEDKRREERGRRRRNTLVEGAGPKVVVLRKAKSVSVPRHGAQPAGVGSGEVGACWCSCSYPCVRSAWLGGCT